MFTPESSSLKRPAPTRIVPVPLKRRKTENTANSQSPSIPVIKTELSPSPPPTAPRTSGTKCISLPDVCQKTNIAWKENRDKWVAAETKILRELGLQIVKRIVRDDGLAIDWRSNVPVDPVTLRPLPAARSKPGSPLHDLRTPPTTASKPTDHLGHALRDQTAVACQPIPSPPPVQLLKERSLCSPRNDVSPTANGDGSLNIAVVGAALLKEHHPSIVEETSGTSGQTEHRKLLPPELRANYRDNKEKREKRNDYVNSQIEYVEGYTGEKYVGLRYEGNYIIITVGKKTKPGSNRTGRQPKQIEGQQGVIESREDNSRRDHWGSSQRWHNGSQPRWNQWKRVPDEHSGTAPHDRNGRQNHGQLPQQHAHVSTGGYHAYHTPGYAGTHVPAIHKRGWIPPVREDATPSSSKRRTPSVSGSEDRHSVDILCTNTPEKVAMPSFPPTEIPQPPEWRPSPTVEVRNDSFSLQYPLEDFTSRQEPEGTTPSSSKRRIPSVSSSEDRYSVDILCTTTPEKVATEIPQPPASRPSPTVEVGNDSFSLQYSLEDFTSRQEPSALELQSDKEEAPLQIESLHANVDVPVSLDEAGQTADATERGLAFLKQFMHMFDTDRHSLVEVYSPNASLLLTDDFTTLLMGGHSPHSVTRVGPDAIVKALQCIDSEVRHSATFSHTIIALDDMDSGGLVVTCQGMLLPGQAGQAQDIFFSRIFVLMKNRRPNQLDWPLQIVSDNLVLRRQRR